MASVEIDDAKSRLEELLDQVAEGQEFIILRGGRPLALLTPVDRQPVVHDGMELIRHLPEEYQAVDPQSEP